MRTLRLTLGWIFVLCAFLATFQPPLATAYATHGFGSSASPTTRCCNEMAPDRLGHLVLFGGYNPEIRPLGDTWTWDGSTWTRQEPTAAPTARCCYAMAYDHARQETVLFGGYGKHGYLRDTWTWDGTVWTREAPTHSPPREYEPTMAYDENNGVVVLFGNDDNDLRADTWIWDGEDWQKAHPSFSPIIRSGAGIAYDSISDRVILFGGVDDLSCGDTGCADFRDTFDWDGLTWTKLHPHPEPDKRSYMGMAQDPLTGGVVLFGGVQDFLGGAIFGDTWEWNGTDWAEVRLDVRPAKRDGMAMAYLPASNQVVMFGGTAYGVAWYGDTWLWDGSSWSEPSLVSASEP